MTLVARFTTAEDAHLFRAYLGVRGIRGYLLDEYIVQVNWLYSLAVGGVRLVVLDDEAPGAAAAYRDYRAALGTGIHPDNQVRAWPFVALLSLLVGVPLLVFGRGARLRRSGRSPGAE